MGTNEGKRNNSRFDILANFEEDIVANSVEFNRGSGSGIMAKVTEEKGESYQAKTGDVHGKNSGGTKKANNKGYNKGIVINKGYPKNINDKGKQTVFNEPKEGSITNIKGHGLDRRDWALNDSGLMTEKQIVGVNELLDKANHAVVRFEKNNRGNLPKVPTNHFPPSSSRRIGRGGGNRQITEIWFF